jgi:electron transfer flavoprotein alpha subunit
MDFSYLDSWIEEEAGKEVIEETGTGYRNIWVVAEAADGALIPASLQAMGAARDLADQIGVYVYGVLLGEHAAPLAEDLIAYGADKVLVADNPALDTYQAETHTKALADLVGQYRPEILLLAATALGSDLAPRLAERLNTGLISHCVKVEIDMSERLLLGTFKTLGGEMYRTLTCPEARPQMATIQPGYLRTPARDAYRSGDVQKVEVDQLGITGRLTWTDLDAAVDKPSVPLRKARIVVSAGRGMGDAEGFALVEQLAAALGGVVAGTRGALDAGWIAEEQVVGIGGEMIAPDLYVACGLSGDIHHYYGMSKARLIVAINADERAPIMKLAHYAVVGDARQIIPAMLQALA